MNKNIDYIINNKGNCSCSCSNCEYKNNNIKEFYLCRLLLIEKFKQRADNKSITIAMSEMKIFSAKKIKLKYIIESIK